MSGNNLKYNFESINRRNYKGQENAKLYAEEFVTQINRIENMQDDKVLFDFNIRESKKLLNKIRAQLNNGEVQDLPMQIPDTRFRPKIQTITGYLEGALEFAGVSVSLDEQKQNQTSIQRRDNVEAKHSRWNEKKKRQEPSNFTWNDNTQLQKTSLINEYESMTANDSLSNLEQWKGLKSRVSNFVNQQPKRQPIWESGVALESLINKRISFWEEVLSSSGKIPERGEGLDSKREGNDKEKTKRNDTSDTIIAQVDSGFVGDESKGSELKDDNEIRRDFETLQINAETASDSDSGGSSSDWDLTVVTDDDKSTEESQISRTGEASQTLESADCGNCVYDNERWSCKHCEKRFSSPSASTDAPESPLPATKTTQPGIKKSANKTFRGLANTVSDKVKQVKQLF